MGRSIEEPAEDVDAFVAALESNGVTVKRPDNRPHEATFSTIRRLNSGGHTLLLMPCGQLLDLNSWVSIEPAEPQEHLGFYGREAR